MKIFIRCKILSGRTILNACTYTHIHIHAGAYTHNYTMHDLQTRLKKILHRDTATATGGENITSLLFWKKKCSEADLQESTEGFHQRRRGWSVHAEQSKAKEANTIKKKYIPKQKKYKLILTSSSLTHSYDTKQLRIPNCQSAECFSQCSEHLNIPTWKNPTEAAVFSPKANAEQQSERLHLEQNLQNATVMHGQWWQEISAEIQWGKLQSFKR